MTSGVRSNGATREVLLADVDTIDLDVEPSSAFAPIQRIGGDVGWYFGDRLWAARGLVDSLIGGEGVRRGRRHPTEIRLGDAIDFWRVEAYVPNEGLRLRAEMNLPGDAWLEFRVSGRADGGSRIEQISEFAPDGLAGRLYWHAVHPLHRLVFSGMLKAIGRAAENPRG